MSADLSAEIFAIINEIWGLDELKPFYFQCDVHKILAILVNFVRAKHVVECEVIISI